jgi:hypothetical protein
MTEACMLQNSTRSPITTSPQNRSSTTRSRSIYIKTIQYWTQPSIRFYVATPKERLLLFSTLYPIDSLSFSSLATKSLLPPHATQNLGPQKTSPIYSPQVLVVYLGTRHPFFDTGSVPRTITCQPAHASLPMLVFHIQFHKHNPLFSFR